MVLLMFEWPHSKVPKFWLIRLIASTVLSVLLLIVIPYGLLKTITKNISKKEADEAVEDTSKWLAIYGELSEFEWRSGMTVFERVISRYRTLKETIPPTDERPEIRIYDSGIDIMPPMVILYLLRESDIRCYVRMETRSEFVSRKTKWEVVKSRQLIPDETITALQLMFEQQFDLIAANGKEDPLKNLYLGRELMFLKKIAGGKIKIFPQRHEMETSPA